MIEVTCTCGATYSLPDEYLGKVGACKMCGQEFRLTQSGRFQAKSGKFPVVKPRSGRLDKALGRSGEQKTKSGRLPKTQWGEAPAENTTRLGEVRCRQSRVNKIIGQLGRKIRGAVTTQASEHREATPAPVQSVVLSNSDSGYVLNANKNKSDITKGIECQCCNRAVYIVKGLTVPRKVRCPHCASIFYCRPDKPIGDKRPEAPWRPCVIETLKWVWIAAAAVAIKNPAAAIPFGIIYSVVGVPVVLLVWLIVSAVKGKRRRGLSTSHPGEDQKAVERLYK